MKWRIGVRWRAFRRFFNRFFVRRIATQMVLTYVALGALPLILVSLILISLTQATLQTYIHQRNLETARRAANEIYLFLEGPLTVLHTAALTRDISQMERFAQSSLINRIKEENPFFRKIFILDEAGFVVVTTSFGEEMLNFSQTPFFRRTMEGEQYVSEVYFTHSRFPVLLVAEPILKFNQVVGILAAEVDLKSIWDLVDKIKIGKTGNAYLLSAEGVVIAHLDKEKVFERADYSNYDFVQALRTGQEGITQYTMDGEDFIAAYVPVPRLGWGIVIQQTRREAFTLARQMQARVLLFVALTIVIAIVLGVFGVRRFTRPLARLVAGAREFARGNLAHRISIHSRDELAELAGEFNAMAGSLLRIQRELQRMERLAALSRFASLVSHEIRNPLNAMNINMQILRRIMFRSDVSEQRKLKYLNVIASEISRMNELVSNFMAISRPPELNLVKSDIHQTLEEVILLHEGKAKKENIQICRQFYSAPLVGMFDTNQLKQVFHNVVVNAFQAMEKGGKLVVRTSLVHVRSEEKGKSVPMAQIAFEDSGKGIPPDELENVFEFYYTTKPTGTGLGLAIARQIVEGHRGRIYLESEVGKGTRVFIELPIDSAVRKR